MPALTPIDVVNNRIIEVEWAWKNGKPFQPSPKKSRRRSGKRSKSTSSKAMNPTVGMSKGPSDDEVQTLFEPPATNQKRGLVTIDESGCATPQKRMRVDYG